MTDQTIAARPLGRTGLTLSELGFGTATLGNLYAPVERADAEAALALGLAGGMSFVDTAPFYGFGLSERRVGDVLRGRNNVVVSTKVGRLLRPAADVRSDAERQGYRSAMPFEPVFDYGYDAIMRSHEHSLQRLGLARVDLLLVHDIGTLTHGDDNARHVEALTSGGGFRALTELRSTGAISGFGLGVNEVAICERLMDAADLDLILLAGRYTLLEQSPIDHLFPRCTAAGTAIVVGGPFNSGILATGVRRDGQAHYDYARAPEAVVARVAAIERCCNRFDVPLAAAALQFPLAHPLVASVIPGLGRAAQVAEALRLYRHPVAPAFWHALRDEALIDPRAPIPA